MLEGRGRDNVEGGALRGKAETLWAEGVREQDDTKEGRASPVVFHAHVLDPLLEKWPLGNSAEANRASRRPGFLAGGPGKSKVTSDALPAPAAYAMHTGPMGQLRPRARRYIGLGC